MQVGAIIKSRAAVAGKQIIKNRQFLWWIILNFREYLWIFVNSVIFPLAFVAPFSIGIYTLQKMHQSRTIALHLLTQKVVVKRNSFTHHATTQIDPKLNDYIRAFWWIWFDSSQCWSQCVGNCLYKQKFTAAQLMNDSTRCA